MPSKINLEERITLERADRVAKQLGCEIQLGTARSYKAGKALEAKGLGHIEDRPGGYPRFYINQAGKDAL